MNFLIFSPSLYYFSKVVGYVQVKPQRYQNELPKLKNDDELSLFADELCFLAKEMGLTNRLIIREPSYPQSPAARGSNISICGHSEILISKKDFDIDPEAGRFCFRHEVSHLVNNESLMSPLIAGVTYIAMAVLLSPENPEFLKAVTVVVISVIITEIAEILFSRYIESRADSFAIATSTDAELRGGMRFFTAQKEKNLSEKNSPLMESIISKIPSFLVSSPRDFYIEPDHPSLTSRCAKIEQEMSRRGLSLEFLPGESEKICKLENQAIHRWYVKSHCSQFRASQRLSFKDVW